MGTYWESMYDDTRKPANPDSTIISESLRAVGVLASASREEIDAVLAAIDAETGEPLEINPNGDPRALVAQEQSDAHYLRSNRQNAILALRLAASGVCFVEVIGAAQLDGLPTDGPALRDDPDQFNRTILNVVGVKARSAAKHGQTSIEFHAPWREVVTRYVFKRPAGVKVGPPVQFADGVRLVTDGLLPLPTSRATMDGQPISFTVPLWAERVERGAWDFHMQRTKPDAYFPLLVELPDAVAALASKSKKRAA